MINRLVEAGLKTLQPDFLEYHRDTPSPDRGVRSEIVETEEFRSREKLATRILGALPRRSSPP